MLTTCWLGSSNWRHPLPEHADWTKKHFRAGSARGLQNLDSVKAESITPGSFVFLTELSADEVKELLVSGTEQSGNPSLQVQGHAGSARVGRATRRPSSKVHPGHGVQARARAPRGRAYCPGGVTKARLRHTQVWKSAKPARRMLPRCASLVRTANSHCETFHKIIR